MSVLWVDFGRLPAWLPRWADSNGRTGFYKDPQMVEAARRRWESSRSGYYPPRENNHFSLPSARVYALSVGDLVPVTGKVVEMRGGLNNMLTIRLEGARAE
jgi:hypothetical protein